MAQQISAMVDAGTHQRTKAYLPSKKKIPRDLELCNEGTREVTASEHLDQLQKGSNESEVPELARLCYQGG
jgi:hypothetical protein